MKRSSPQHYRHTLDPIQELQIAVFGLDGTNGLMARQRSTDARLEEYDDLFMKSRFLVKVLRWIGLGMTFLVIVLAPDDLADGITKAIGAVKTLGGLI